MEKRREITTRRDYRLWFYGIKFRKELEELLQKHGGIEHIIKEQLEKHDNDLEKLIKYMVQIRFRLYKTYVSSAKSYSTYNHYFTENEILKTIKKIDIIEDVTSFYTMKMIVAAYPEINDYVVKMETALFMKMIERALIEPLYSYPIVATESSLVTSDEMLYYIFRALFEDDVDLKTLTFDYVTDPKNKKIKIKNGKVRIQWKRLLSLLPKLRNIDLDHGMVEVPYKYFLPIIEYNVEKLFRSAFEDYRNDYVNDESLQIYKKVAIEMFSSFSSNHDYDDIELAHTDDIDQIIDNSPLCIQILDHYIRKGISISYSYAIQLSFYIKSFFTVDGLAWYWWKRDKRNRIYKTVEEFKEGRRDLMYHFNHQYGMGSSSTNYKAMKCSTCQYPDQFCFFTQRKETIEKTLRELYEKEYENSSYFNRIIEKILRAVDNKKYGLACAYELSLRLHVIMKKLKEKNSLYIHHPLLQYYKTCSSMKNNRNEKNEEKH